MTSWFGWALAAAVFAAMTAVLAKVGVAGVDADLATWVRTVVVLAVLSLLLVATGQCRNPLRLPPRTLAFLSLSGVATGASWLCYFRALQLGNASQVAPVDKASVVLVALFAVVFLGERPAPREWLGIALVTAGVIVLAWRR